MTPDSGVHAIPNSALKKKFYVWYYAFFAPNIKVPYISLKITLTIVKIILKVGV